MPEGADVPGAEAGAGLSGVGSQAHRLYLSTKFERRGLTLYTIFQQIFSANGARFDSVAARQLGDLPALLAAELAAGRPGSDGGNLETPPLRVASIGGGPGTDAASMIWVSRHHLGSRPVACCLLDPDARWRRHLPALRRQIDGGSGAGGAGIIEPLPMLELEFEACDVTQPLGEAPASTAAAAGAASTPAGPRKAARGAAAAGREPQAGTADDAAAAAAGAVSAFEAAAAGPAEDEEHAAECLSPRAAAIVAAEAAAAARSPNARAAARLFGGADGDAAAAASVDVFLVSYACHEAQAAGAAGNWAFFRGLAARARPGAVFLFVDVLHRSREVLDQASAPLGRQRCVISLAACMRFPLR
jgi:hypothetical protein